MDYFDKTTSSLHLLIYLPVAARMSNLCERSKTEHQLDFKPSEKIEMPAGLRRVWRMMYVQPTPIPDGVVSIEGIPDALGRMWFQTTPYPTHPEGVLPLIYFGERPVILKVHIIKRMALGD
jgi:hypothetical protein